MSANKNYVYRLMCARCDCGTMDNYLNIKKDHGILVNEDMQPILNANDHTNDNVIHFGDCNSDCNPELYLRKGLFTMLGGPTGFLLGEALDKLGVMSIKCKPQTPNPWEFTDETHMIDGAPAITLQSELSCKNGGTITIAPLNADSTEEDLELPSDIDEPIEEEHPLTIVTNGINATLEDAFSKIQQTGEVDASIEEKVKAALIVSTVLPPQYTQEEISRLMSIFPEDFNFEQGILSVTTEQKIRNYNHNFAQDLPTDADGMIIDQSQFSNFVSGNTTMNATGCGAIATYNVLKMINPNEEINFAHVVYYLEPYGIANGAFGTIPFGVTHYLNAQGYNVELVYGVENIVEKAASADAAIAVYAYGDNISNVGAHYTAFQPYNNFDTQEFIFYNDDYGVQNHLRTEEEWIKDLEGKKVIGDALAIIINQQ
ncbi:MAG: PAAR-like protein [Eubacteriales bacterium]